MWDTPFIKVPLFCSLLWYTLSVVFSRLSIPHLLLHFFCTVNSLRRNIHPFSINSNKFKHLHPMQFKFKLTTITVTTTSPAHLHIFPLHPSTFSLSSHLLHLIPCRNLVQSKDYQPSLAHSLPTSNRLKVWHICPTITVFAIFIRHYLFPFIFSFNRITLLTLLTLHVFLCIMLNMEACHGLIKLYNKYQDLPSIRQ